jgi:uncharacterized oligopeptide transporter (OPT) family protein
LAVITPTRFEELPMTDDNQERRGTAAKPLRNSVGAWIVVAVLSLLLVASGVFGYLGSTIGDANIPTSGYVAMAVGVVFSLFVGIGLMALVFYSSRKGYDEPALLIEEPGADRDHVKKTSQENDA